MYLMFDSCVIVVAMNSTLTQTSLITLPTGLPAGTVFSMDTFGNYYQNFVAVWNCTNETNIVQLFNFTIAANIDDVRVRFPFLIIASNGSLIQYDMDLKAIINTFSNATLGWRIQLFNFNILYMYKDGVTNYPSFSTFKFDGTIAIINGTCPQGYYINSSLCVKNLTYVYPPTTTNTTANTTNTTTTNTTKTTTNTTTSTNTTNTTNTNASNTSVVISPNSTTPTQTPATPPDQINSTLV